MTRGQAPRRHEGHARLVHALHHCGSAGRAVRGRHTLSRCAARNHRRTPHEQRARSNASDSRPPHRFGTARGRRRRPGAVRAHQLRLRRRSGILGRLRCILLAQLDTTREGHHTVALPPDFAAIRTFSLKKSQKALQTLTIIHLMHPEPFPVTRNAGMPGFRPIFATIRPSPDLLRSSQAPLAMGIAVDSCPAVQEKSPFSRFHNLPQHAEPSSRPTNAHKACHNHESALIMQGTW